VNPSTFCVRNSTEATGEALLRSCGFKIIAQPGHEVHVCEPDFEKLSVNKTWNQSEYLAATGANWQLSYEEKVKK
jgi:tRNA (mo5U34)-methyltransferase